MSIMQLGALGEFVGAVHTENSIRGSPTNSRPSDAGDGIRAGPTAATLAAHGRTEMPRRAPVDSRAGQGLSGPTYSAGCSGSRSSRASVADGDGSWRS